MVIYIGFKIASFTFVLITHFHNYKFLLKYFIKLDSKFEKLLFNNWN